MYAIVMQLCTIFGLEEVFSILKVIHKRLTQEWGRLSRRSGHMRTWGRDSSKSERPHLVQNLSIYMLDHGENHDSKKYNYKYAL